MSHKKQLGVLPLLEVLMEFNFRLPKEMQLPRTDKIVIGCRVEKQLATKLRKIAGDSHIYFDHFIRSILEDYVSYYESRKAS